MNGIDGLLSLFSSEQFLMNCLATYAVVHVARANTSVVSVENRRWAKLSIDVLNLIVGITVSLLVKYSDSAATNVVVGLIAALFSAQVYNTVKRYLPERLGGENDAIIVEREERRRRKIDPTSNQ
jgi:ABC-type Co2+ transport system permease subunit